MTEVAPWLQPQIETAPWLAEQPTAADYAIDVAKAAPSGLAKGVIGVAGTGGDLANVAKAAYDKATEKGINPFSFLAKKFEDSTLGQFLKKESAPYQNNRASGDLPGSYELPTSADLKRETEKVTGKLYDPKYGPGKATETAFEIAPMLAGNPARAIIAKATGAGIASELAGEGAEATKHLLPEKAQPWAEPVARAAGAFGGTFTPAGVRKVVTPLPMTDEQHSVVQALKKTDPDFVNVATAGQLTKSPSLMAIEARSLPNQAAKQQTAFTEATLGRGEDTGKKIGNIYDTNSINSTEFPILNQSIAKEKRRLAGITGTAAAQDALGEIQKDIKLGAANSPQTLNMTGKRYQYMRDRLQGMIESESNNTVKKALTNTKTALDEAFDRSIPNAAELADLRRQKQTFEAIANRTPNLSGEVTPESILSAAAHAEGNRAVNTGKSPLANWARDANEIMTPLPRPNTEGGPMTKVLGGLVGGLSGAGMGHFAGGAPAATSEGLLGAFMGMGHANDVVQALKNLGSKAITTAPAQKYLGNQVWRPGSASSVPTREELIRLLMAPTVQGQ